MTPPTGLWSRWGVRYRRIRQRRWARWGIDLAMLAALVLEIGAWQTRSHLSGGQAPDAVLTTLAGERVSLDSLRGKPVVLAFCDLLDARTKLAAWRQDYNEHRPHGSIGNLTPVEFARSVRMTGPNEANSSA